jgi:DNA polymerase-3 subunit epsilon
LDVETACSDAAIICQFGLACVQRDNRIQTFSMVVNPRSHFDPFNIGLHGIGPDHVADALPFYEAFETTLPLLARHHLIQHSNFDKRPSIPRIVFWGLNRRPFVGTNASGLPDRRWPELKGNGGHGPANLTQVSNTPHLPRSTAQQCLSFACVHRLTRTVLSRIIPQTRTNSFVGKQ